MKDIKEQALELCHEIEKLPAGEQQTKVSVMASELNTRIADLERGFKRLQEESDQAHGLFHEPMEIGPVESGNCVDWATVHDCGFDYPANYVRILREHLLKARKAIQELKAAHP